METSDYYVVMLDMAHCCLFGISAFLLAHRARIQAPHLLRPTSADDVTTNEKIEINSETEPLGREIPVIHDHSTDPQSAQHALRSVVNITLYDLEHVHSNRESPVTSMMSLVCEDST